MTEDKKPATKPTRAVHTEAVKPGATPPSRFSVRVVPSGLSADRLEALMPASVAMSAAIYGREKG